MGLCNTQLLEMSNKITTYIENLAIITRPNSGHGVWLMFLLPLSIIISAFRHPIVLTPTYKLASIFCAGLICTTLIFLYQCLKNQKLQLANILNIMLTILLSFIFYYFSSRAVVFSLISGLLCTCIYFYLFIFVLKTFPQCFTLGEAALVTQSLGLLIYCTGINLYIAVISSNNKMFTSNMQISTVIIQIGLLGIGLLSFGVFRFKIKTPTGFYVYAIFTIMFGIFLPLHILLDQSPLLWIFSIMFYDMSSIKLLLYWSFCTGVAVLAVSNQIFYAQKATTSQRKVFHILAVSVYIPGLLYKCSFLYLASGVILGIFFALELLRIAKIPPVGAYLQDGFSVFSDDKDVGVLALTPIYLLAGCSLPLWIHPAPCDVTDSAMFSILPLLSGLLSIGIGDTAASFVGSKYGQHFWKDSKKTIEGTAACILSQIAVVCILNYLGCIQELTVISCAKIVAAILITSLVEAKTTQVDNLVLPLVMYTILI